MKSAVDDNIISWGMPNPLILQTLTTFPISIEKLKVPLNSYEIILQNHRYLCEMGSMILGEHSQRKKKTLFPSYIPTNIFILS